MENEEKSLSYIPIHKVIELYRELVEKTEKLKELDYKIDTICLYNDFYEKMLEIMFYFEKFMEKYETYNIHSHNYPEEDFSNKDLFSKINESLKKAISCYPLNTPEKITEFIDEYYVIEHYWLRIENSNNKEEKRIPPEKEYETEVLSKYFVQKLGGSPGMSELELKQGERFYHNLIKDK